MSEVEFDPEEMRKKLAGGEPEQQEDEAPLDEVLSATMEEMGHVPNGSLPPDVARVWNGIDSQGFPAAESARSMIAAWGLQGFRESKIHKQAVQEHERGQRLAAERELHRKEREKKEKKK